MDAGRCETRGEVKLWGRGQSVSRSSENYFDTMRRIVIFISIFKGWDPSREESFLSIAESPGFSMRAIQ